MKRSAIVAVGLCLAVLSGCSQTPEPSPPPSSEDALTTSTPDKSEATSEAPPTDAAETEEPEADGPPQMPEEATEQTEAGAEAFVEYYLNTLNAARASRDASELQRLATEECESCRNFEESATSGSSDPLEYDVESATMSSLLATVQVAVVDGSTSGTAYFTLEWDSAWRVSAVQAKA
ncbi:DUF6318 family protein [Ornithinimicrobium avium]|uniref:DUF6318 domain-containing protein n=1 Tax=Ornithinimicrobium avium TaxID=2283195 RepID=A0A345NL58_9MICO|nr:DUF6318 family protein [Ornithinimicrobium avium]AXH95766.1 hypothetical protein DV701_06160 [Ornithinimicrobium avium]